jgi:hypothetical protein
MTPARGRVLAVTLALVAFAAAPGRAQIIFESPPPITLDIETSIRSAAMGGAGSAVFWGEPDVWANPATLATLHGVGWVQGHTQLNPSFSNDVVFDTQQLMFGGQGVGVVMMGQPFSGLGKAHFDSGPIIISGPFPTEPFSLFETTESFGLGVSPLRLLDALRAETGTSHPRLTDVGEIAFGYQTERTSSGVDPGIGPFDDGESYDWGVNGRLSLQRMWWREAPFRLDVAAAFSLLNHSHKSDGSFGGPPTRFRRTGFALHGSPRPAAERASQPASLPWWRPADVPEFSVTLAYDHELQRVEQFDRDSNVERVGLEAEAFRLLALRVGYVSDPDAEIHAVAYGGGVTLPVGPWGSVGYQLAYEPLSDDLKPRFRQGFSVWLDPVRVLGNALRR